MKKHFSISLLFFFTFIISCVHKPLPEIAFLQKISDSSYKIVPYHTSNSPGRSDWDLSYPVFNFYIADIDGKGEKDIVAGVIKKTRFDPIVRKRIFIFKMFDGKIRPLWLGSRVGQPLKDFCIVQRKDNTDIIRTIEYEEDGSYLSADYEWKGFGLSFISYNVRLTDSVTVYKQFSIHI